LEFIEQLNCLHKYYAINDEDSPFNTRVAEHYAITNELIIDPANILGLRRSDVVPDETEEQLTKIIINKVTRKDK
jgi:hypothetical protein